MVASERADLGHGVSVAADDPSLIWVDAVGLWLPWKPRAGPMCGTAVAWRGDLYEAVSRKRSGDGRVRWRLEPWPEGEAIRVSASLDEQTVAEIASTTREDREKDRQRQLLLPLLPLTGALPLVLQERLERERNVPATLATLVSAFVEFIIGGLGVAELLLGLAGGGRAGHALPHGLRWLAFVGPFLAIDAAVRAWFSNSQRQPIGSAFLAPLAIFAGPRPPGPTRAELLRPTAIGWDPDADSLTLTTADPRTDWLEDGVLGYRGGRWRLVSSGAENGRPVYHFEAVDDVEALTLSLSPPDEHPVERQRGRGIVADTVRFVALAFAPGRTQELLAPGLGVNALLLTLFSALAELLGSWLNLRDGSAGALVLVDIALLVEGLSRCVLAVVTRSPVGSVLGLPLLPIYRRWEREALS